MGKSDDPPTREGPAVESCCWALLEERVRFLKVPERVVVDGAAEAVGFGETLVAAARETENLRGLSDAVEDLVFRCGETVRLGE